ncbi:unnamed protein product [Rangifer tarandus platyrhynchus]|uniref:Uncharacterized protein n=1 Tax=Rangifer tarandus platyrhynchus TaxID=3082113 RepID=A0AC59YQP9_RANTA
MPPRAGACGSWHSGFHTRRARPGRLCSFGTQPPPLRPRLATVAAGNRAAQRAANSAFPERPPPEAPTAFPENSPRSRASRLARPHAGAGGLPRPAPPIRLRLDSM